MAARSRSIVRSKGAPCSPLRCPSAPWTATGADAAPPAKPSASQRTILVVDDEAEIRETLAEILTGARHRVVTASSGREALERMAAEHYDVILTDIRMPDLDGRALYQEIERRWPGQAGRVVFVTGDTLASALREFVSESGRPGDREAIPAERSSSRRRRAGDGTARQRLPIERNCLCRTGHSRAEPGTRGRSGACRRRVKQTKPNWLRGEMPLPHGHPRLQVFRCGQELLLRKFWGSTAAMATLPDSLGLITSTDDPLSLERFEQALASLFRSDGKAVPAIERAIERDPAFAVGHCLRAGAIVLSGGRHARGSAGRIDCRDRAQLRRERARTQACRRRAPLARRRRRARGPPLRRAAPRLSARPAGAARGARPRFPPWPARHAARPRRRGPAALGRERPRVWIRARHACVRTGGDGRLRSARWRRPTGRSSSSPTTRRRST